MGGDPVAKRESGREAGDTRGRTPKHQGAKGSGGAKDKELTMRVQLHLPVQVVQRLGVHCTMVNRNQSAVAGEILLSWLARYGKHREVFPSLVEQGGRDLLTLPDTLEDRQDGAVA
jgi:hypothetical protein